MMLLVLLSIELWQEQRFFGPNYCIIYFMLATKLL